MSVNRENYSLTGTILFKNGCTTHNGYEVGDAEIQNSIKLLTKTDISFLIKNKNYTDTLLIVNASEDEDYETDELFKKRIEDTIKQLDALRDDYNITALVTSGYKDFRTKTFLQPKGTDYSEVNYNGILQDLTIYFKIYLGNVAEQLKQVEEKANTDATTDKATFIWSIANIIWNVIPKKNLGDVILPFTVLRRIDCTLASTAEAVNKRYKEIEHWSEDDIEEELKEVTQLPYFNKSGFNFKKLLYDVDGLYENMLVYLDGFSQEVRDIIKNFNLEQTISRLNDNDILYEVMREFATVDLSADTVSTHGMGYIFEYVLRESASGDSNSGEYFTSHDLVSLCSELLVQGDKVDRTSIQVYDMAMGTSQMLTTTREYINKHKPDVEVDVFGQEITPETFAIAKSDMLMYGGNPENMRLGNTLTNDKFHDFTFDYIISNPPYGVKWGMYKDTIECNLYSGADKRFNVGFPAASDGQLLFTVNGVKKLTDNGRMAIIHNGSPLFNGAAGSGESEIRKWLVDNDYIEAIVKLGEAMFYNTPINTYIWVINRAKEDNRKGFIQLIDASQMVTKMRKSIGSKRNEFSESDREVIIKAYLDFKEEEYESNGKTCESKIITNESLAIKDDAGKQKYEIPFDKLFYKAEEQENSDAIKHRILKLNSKIQSGIINLFGDNTDKVKED